MLTAEPGEAVETAMRVQAAHEEDGGANLDAHLDGYMSGIETVLAKPEVDGRSYLAEIVRQLESKIAATDASGAAFLRAAVERLKAAGAVAK